MKEIYIVTHSESTHHLDGLVGGWYDSRLTETGKNQASKCGQRLQEIGMEYVEIYSSDLKRAAETAYVIAKHLGSAVHLDRRLREMSFGSAEGLPVNEVGTITSSDGTDRLDHRSPFGGETKREFAKRVYDVMQGIAAKKKAIICTHGYATTFLIACWIRMPLASVGYVNFRVRPGSITLLKEDDVHLNRAVEYLGDTTHLA